jgi:transposase
MCKLLGAIREEWGELDARIAALDREFVETARASAAARRLATIPGIGALRERMTAAPRAPELRPARERTAQRTCK